MANRGLHHQPPPGNSLLATGLLAHLHQLQQPQRESHADDNSIANQNFQRHPAHNPRPQPSLPDSFPHEPSSTPHRQASSSADGVSSGGGRLAISYLLNPTAAASTGGGQKRKAIDVDHPVQDLDSTESTSRDADSHHQSRRRLDPLHDAAYASVRPQQPHADLAYQQPKQQYIYSPLHHPQSHVSSSAYSPVGPGGEGSAFTPVPQRMVLPSLSSFMSAHSTSSSPDLQYSSPSTAASQRPSPPGPSSSFSSSSSSSSPSFGLSLAAANPGFFFNSFNCLPSAAARAQASEALDPFSTRLGSSSSSSPSSSSMPMPTSTSTSTSSSTSSTEGGGFYYMPYERSHSAPASPKLYVGEDTGGDDEDAGDDDAREDHGYNGDENDDSSTVRRGRTEQRDHHGGHHNQHHEQQQQHHHQQQQQQQQHPHFRGPAVLTHEQLQLRMQTQALQTQLMLRQMQRNQNILQLKRLHAQQQRKQQRSRSEAHSATVSFMSSPSRTGEGQGRRRRGDADEEDRRADGEDEGEDEADENEDEDDDDDDPVARGDSDLEDDGVEVARRGRGQPAARKLGAKEMARTLDDKLRQLKRKLSQNELEDAARGDSQAAAVPAQFQQPSPQERRRRATPAQLAVLEETFADDPFPSRDTKQQLAQRLDMHIRSITIWFQNKRARLKKSAALV